jgi:hypothetical protein
MADNEVGKFHHNSIHERAIPWQNDEYIWVSGYKLVYTFDNEGEMTVRFPGGGFRSLKSLLRMPVIVQEPKKVRNCDLFA